MKASLFRYLWEQEVFKRLLKFQAPLCMIKKNVFRLSTSTSLSGFAITYAFRFLKPKDFVNYNQIDVVG